MNNIFKIKYYNQLVTPKLSKDAIRRNDFPGFKEDYLTIHCLIKKYKPKTFMEVGTSTGLGTKVICAAMGLKKKTIFDQLFNRKSVFDKKVYSIDVLPGTNPTIIYPGKEDGHPDKAGKYCNLPYTQLYGNSQKFDFSKYYPLNGWFIDGKHNFVFTKTDTRQALKSSPKLIIWHDTQINEVSEAIIVAMKGKNYKLFLIKGTRVAYAVKK